MFRRKIIVGYDEDISTQYPYISMLSFVELYMKESIFVLMFVGVIATLMITSSLTPEADSKIKRGCNENTNTQTGNPHGDQNPTGNPHDYEGGGNPHNECI